MYEQVSLGFLFSRNCPGLDLTVSLMTTDGSSYCWEITWWSGRMYWNPGQATPKCTSMAYGLFWVEVPYEATYAKRTLWPSFSDSLKSGHKSVMWKVLSGHPKEEGYPLLLNLGNLGPRNLYKQICYFFNLLPQAQTLSRVVPSWTPQIFVLSIPHKYCFLVYNHPLGGTFQDHYSCALRPWLGKIRVSRT